MNEVTYKVNQPEFASDEPVHHEIDRQSDSDSNLNLADSGPFGEDGDVGICSTPLKCLVFSNRIAEYSFKFPL